MSRSWLALALVVAIIAVAVVIQVTSRPKTPPTGEESKGTPAVPKETTPEPPPKKTPEPPPETKKAPEEAKKPEPVTDPDTVLKEADTQIAANKQVEARKLLSHALLVNPGSEKAGEFKTRLTKLSEELLFSPRPSPLAAVHEVAPGDTLGKIAGKHKTTVELIRRINGLKDDTIRPGQKLKAIPGGFDVEVVKGSFLLTVTKDGVWVREFKVGLGKDGSTPVGEFVAGHKLEKPTYFGDGAAIPFGDKKNNPLGTRWITIEGQYGIHGTWEPESMGKEMSKGCVRMLNEDVEWLYDLIVPGVSKIAIKP